MAIQIMGATTKTDETSVPLPRSIAAKIFGLAVFVLLMTIALTCFLLWEISRIEHSLRVVSQHDVPLAQAISHIDYTALRRQLRFHIIEPGLQGGAILRPHVARETTAAFLQDVELHAQQRTLLGQFLALIALFGDMRRVSCSLPLRSSRRCSSKLTVVCRTSFITVSSTSA